MFGHVIVGVDRPDDAVDTIAHARVYAPNAQLTLAAVYPFAGHFGAVVGDDLSGYERALKEDRLALLADVRDRAGVPDAELFTAGGVSAARILRTLAQKRGADLIVLGPSHRSTLGRMVLGEVSRGVLHGAACPVMVVPRGRPRRALPATIGVAFDRSPESQLALDVGLAVATPLHCTLDLAAAIDLGTLPETWDSIDGTRVRDLRRGVELALREVAANLSVPTLVDVQVGSPKQVLGPFSGRVDLVVCGSRSWGPLARIALGSTSDWLIHHAQCPVLVVPSAARSATESRVAESVGGQA